MLRRPVLAVLLAALVGGCGSGAPEVESAPSLPWGQEALEYFAALEAAVVAGDGAAAAAFYAPAGVIDVVPGERVLEGWSQIQRWMAAFGPNREYGAVQRVFVGASEALVPRGGVPLWVGDVVAMSSYRLGEDGIEHETLWYPSVVAGLMAGPAAALQSNWEGLYRDYVAAWNAGSPRSGYAPGAQRVDALFGRSAGAEPAYLPGVESSAAWSVAAVTLEEGMDAELAGPALFLRPSRPQEGRFYAMAEVGSESGCPVTVLAGWELADGLIAAETLYYEVTSLRRCAADLELAPLPDGWWSGISPPEPFRYDVSGELVTSTGHTITLVNAAAVQADLVEWALGRFASAGLAPPAVAEVRFPPTVACLRESGWTVLDREAYVIEICADHTEVCADADCATYALAVRVSVLHELAHVWLDQHLDEVTRAEFLALRRLDTWYDASVPWAQRGVEHAAEIVMWGLMDQPLELVRLADDACADLAAAFELLTGLAPPASRCQASSSG